MLVQVKDTPMSSPTNGLFAEAVLQSLEWLVFSFITPKFCRKYINDTFVVIKQYQIYVFSTFSTPGIESMEEMTDNPF